MVEDCLVGRHGVDGYIAEGVIYLLKVMILQALVFLAHRNEIFLRIFEVRGHEFIFAGYPGKL